MDEIIKIAINGLPARRLLFFPAEFYYLEHIFIQQTGIQKILRRIITNIP